MKILLTILSIILPITILAQKPTKIVTDSSVIETKYFNNINSIRVFNTLTSKSISYYKEYYLDTKQLKKEGIFDHGNYAGIWKTYTPEGALENVINYNDSIWSVNNKKNFPFFDLQEKMKYIGDSLIILAYGRRFFNKHVEWDNYQSYIYNSNESGHWCEKFKSKPTKFLLRYDIRLDLNHIYQDMIEFELDSNGKFIDTSYEEIYGFEKLSIKSDSVFNLTFSSAIEFARQNGLIETDSTKATAFLKWQDLKSFKFFNGSYDYYIIQKYKSEKVDGVKPNFYRLYDYYNVWIFNPWTGDFVVKKKMRTVFDWEAGAGTSSGLHEY